MINSPTLIIVISNFFLTFLTIIGSIHRIAASYDLNAGFTEWNCQQLSAPMIKNVIDQVKTPPTTKSQLDSMIYCL